MCFDFYSNYHGNVRQIKKLMLVRLCRNLRFKSHIKPVGRAKHCDTLFLSINNPSCIPLDYSFSPPFRLNVQQTPYAGFPDDYKLHRFKLCTVKKLKTTISDYYREDYFAKVITKTIRALKSSLRAFFS